VAAGAVFAGLLGAMLGWPGFGGARLPALSLLFLLLTTALLVLDLKRPERFLYVLVKANARSWLARGAWILLGFGAVLAVWLWAVLSVRPDVVAFLRGPLVALALGAAGYSAFLFAQAEGRDFWQSPVVLPHLVVAAVTAGAAMALLVLPPSAPLRMLLLLGLGLNVLLVFAECYTPHPNADASAAARLITRGSLRHVFWGGVIAGGTLLPALLLIPASGATSVLAGVLALVGLYLWEDCWVRAGQAVPLS
jgi:formate-dependent nitrite reductase membrane component NrfD